MKLIISAILFMCLGFNNKAQTFDSLYNNSEVYSNNYSNRNIAKSYLKSYSNDISLSQEQILGDSPNQKSTIHQYVAKKANELLKAKLEPTMDSTSKLQNNVYLGIAGGVKYQSIGGQKESEMSQSLLLSIMFNVSEEENSFLGVEAKYYKNGWNTRDHIENVIFLTPFYQWNSILFSDIYLAMQIGITIFSNNVALLFSNSLDIGFNYKQNGIIFFAKNSFNVNYLLLSNIVSITNIGVHIAL